MTTDFTLTCPIPLSDYPNVTLAHGGGGRLMHNLIDKLFAATFARQAADAQHDGAVFATSAGHMAFTTDSYVVQPLFFPGGDIGTLAVNGTVNDLAMCGAHPLYLSVGLILEEGLPMDTLWRIAQSIANAADAAGVQVITGDTKVVDKGKGDGIFINTAGVGVLSHDLHISPLAVRPDDVVILSGDIGRHGIAIMAAREGLSFESAIESDCAPLAGSVRALLDAGIDVRCLRDLTRGGLASALVEIASAGGVQIAVDEATIPVNEDVRGACEILGLDPLYVANEGRYVAFVPPHQAEAACDIMGDAACIIGRVQSGAGRVVLRSVIGADRLIDMLSGEQLPRIC